MNWSGADSMSGFAHIYMKLYLCISHLTSRTDVSVFLQVPVAGTTGHSSFTVLHKLWSYADILIKHFFYKVMSTLKNTKYYRVTKSFSIPAFPDWLLYLILYSFQIVYRCMCSMLHMKNHSRSHKT